jgi:hypothetical protein
MFHKLQIALISAEVSDYSRENFDTFTKLFDPPDDIEDDILSISDVLRTIENAVQQVLRFNCSHI